MHDIRVGLVRGLFDTPPAGSSSGRHLRRQGGIGYLPQHIRGRSKKTAVRRYAWLPCKKNVLTIARTLTDCAPVRPVPDFSIARTFQAFLNLFYRLGLASLYSDKEARKEASEQSGTRHFRLSPDSASVSGYFVFIYCLYIVISSSYFRNKNNFFTVINKICLLLHPDFKSQESFWTVMKAL